MGVVPGGNACLLARGESGGGDVGGVGDGAAVAGVNKGMSTEDQEPLAVSRAAAG